jgi:hypothetical protein
MNPNGISLYYIFSRIFFHHSLSFCLLFGVFISHSLPSSINKIASYDSLFFSGPYCYYGKVYENFPFTVGGRYDVNKEIG